MTENRAEIPAKYKWDLTAIYENEKAFDEDYDAAKEIIEKFPAHEGTMKASAAGLLSCLKDMVRLERILSKLFSYAGLNADLDTTDNSAVALEGRVMNLANDAGAASYFISPALINLDDDTLARWYSECPELKAYTRMIDGSRRYKQYTLSDENEKLLANLDRGIGGYGQIRSTFANADIDFGYINGEDGKKVHLTDANYVAFLMSPDRRVRRAAFTKMYKTYKQYGNTFAALMNAFVKERTTSSKVRGYESSLQCSVYADEVTPVIYNTLIETVNKNLPVLYDYYKLKKEVMGLSKYHLYDIYTPLIGECTKKYSYEEAVEEVLDAVRVFGSEYHDVLEHGIKEKSWVDVYPSRGKRSGAYSGGCYDTEPYILLNYTETLEDISTLAHEAGHSMHSYFSRERNTPQESEYKIFVAEVASTVNELIFAHKKLRESDSREEKLAILNQLLETYKGTLFRQTMFAEFERDMHAMCEAGQTLTRDLLCEKYYETVKRYFGPAVVCDSDIAYEWMRIPHFYMFFYVYKYATCISAASSIVKRIETEGDAYIGKYLEFLSCGGSKSPLDSLKVADIDMSDPSVIEDAIADFADTIRQFREIYNS